MRCWCPFSRQAAPRSGPSAWWRQGVPAAAMATVAEALQDAPLVQHPHPVTGRPLRSLPLPLLIDGQRLVAPRGPDQLGGSGEQALAEWLSDAPAPAGPPGMK